MHKNGGQQSRSTKELDKVAEADTVQKTSSTKELEELDEVKEDESKDYKENKV